MIQKRQYKQYPQAFKEEAVALVSDQGYSVPEAANSLGIRSNLLYRWKDKIDEEAAGTALAEDERIELQRLRKENKELRMEQEILKKVSALFVKVMKKLREKGFEIGRHRVHRLMKKLGLVVTQRVAYKATTVRKHSDAVADN